MMNLVPGTWLIFTVILVVADLASLKNNPIASVAQARPKSLYFHTPLKQYEDGCHTLSRGPGVSLDSVNPGLHRLLKDFKTDLEKKRWRNFKTYFHPQARVKKNIGDNINAILLNRYHKPWQFSVYRVWQLQDKDNNKKPYNCPNTEFERIISRFGYQTQYFIVMQIMGQNELGRLILSVAPKKDKDLAIIGFHIQQWSHQGKDWQKWSQIGNQHLKDKNMKSAFLAYSVAEKMLEGGDFIHYQYRDEIIAEQKKIFDHVQLVSQVRSDGQNENIVYAASLLHLEGTGIFVRVEIAKEESADTLTKICTSIGKSLLASKWLTTGEGGIKCSFIPKGADPTRDSIVGGFYISQRDF